MSEARTYTPSGKFSASAFLWTPLYGVPVGVLGAAAYAYIILYLPIVGYVSFLLTFGLGWLVSIAVNMGLQKGKVRSTLVGSALALGVGLTTLYFQWVTWVFALVQRNDGELGFLTLLFSPGGLWEAMNIINEKGAWTMHGLTPTGAGLWALWAVEAALIVGFPLLAALGVTRAPFCESCHAWCEEKKGLLTSELGEKADVVSHVHALDLAWVESLGPSRSDDAWLRFDFSECGCRQTATLSAAKVTATVKDGKRQLTEDLWVEHQLLPQDAASRAIVIAQRFQQAAPPAPLQDYGTPAHVA